MKECIVTDCNSTELVYSGVDAFVLGVPTEKICYDHANAHYRAQASLEVIV